MTEYFKWSIVQKWLGTDGVSERLSSYCMDGLISLELPEAPLSQPSSSNMTTAAHDEDDHESRHFLSETELIELIGTVQQWQLFIIFLAIVVFAFVVARLSKWVVIGVQKDQETLDSNFDAGRCATSGIIGTTIVSYWSWAASFLQSTTVTALVSVSLCFTGDL